MLLSPTPGGRATGCMQVLQEGSSRGKAGRAQPTPEQVWVHCLLSQLGVNGASEGHTAGVPETYSKLKEQVTNLSRKVALS